MEQGCPVGTWVQHKEADFCFCPTDVKSIPVLAALQSSSLLHGTLTRLYTDLHRVDVRRWASFFSATGVEQDDLAEALHALRQLSHCYKDSSSSVEESEEDDDTD